MRMRIRGAWLLAALLLAGSGCRKPEGTGIILNELKKSAWLYVTEYQIDKIVFATREKTIFWLFKPHDARLVAHARFTVKAGIDLKKMSGKDIVREGDTLDITLPEVTAELSFDPHLEIDYRFTSSSFLNRLTPAFELEVLRKTQREMKRYLNHIRTRTQFEEKIQIRLQTLFDDWKPQLEPLGIRNVRFRFHGSAPRLFLDAPGGLSIE